MSKEIFYKKFTKRWGFLSFAEIILLIILILIYILILSNAPIYGQADDTKTTVGFRGFHYGEVVNSTPTGEKPESKLWWNDGFWWGSLWDPLAESYTIHRFNPILQHWESTGIRIDDRSSSKADVLWDGERLYVVSHIFTKSPGLTPPINAARLYRYNYHTVSNCYEADKDFPVIINESKSETLVIDKDSSGKLWITWVEDGNVMINCSAGDDQNWGKPFKLPGQATPLQTDDISSLVAFGGDKIGIMWSSHNDEKTYFAVHFDHDPDSLWQPREEALADEELGPVSDDHINLKASCDGSGSVFAVTKTSLDSAGPLMFVLKRDESGVWTRAPFSDFQFNHTRPILLVDQDREQIHVFAMSDYTGNNVIYVKSANWDDLVFPPGLGTPFIQSLDDTKVNNVTSTKQCISEKSGLVVLASDNTTRYYLYNFEAGETPSISQDYPADIKFFPNFPNPFNESTIFHFEIPNLSANSAHARLTIYNSSGQKIRSLYNDSVEAGCYDVQWNGRKDDGSVAPSGIYFAVLNVAGKLQQQKLLLVK
jgi:hypothetical protein